MDTAVREAELIIKRAEEYRNRMARFLRGRLRSVDTSILRDLKKELRNFNSQTGEWKNE